MDIRRREFMRLAGGAGACALAGPALAQAYPLKPIRLVLGFAPGTPPDIVARLVASSLSERIGQQVFVDNRSGAGANVATSQFKRAEPDGYSIMLVVATTTINQTLYPNLDFHIARDFQPVTSLLRVANVLVVNPGVPVKSVPEFLAYAKTNPGKLNMASGGNGSSPHISGEMFKSMTGIDMVHVPYSGNYFPDLLSGQVHVVFSAIPGAIGFLKQNQLRALAVTTEKRWESLPELPPLHEFVPGYESSGWYGIVAPKGAPRPIVEWLHKELNAAVADPKVVARLPDLGMSPFKSTPEEFGKFIGDEVDKYAKIIKAANIRVD